IAIARGQEERLGRLAIFGPRGAAAHGLRRGTPLGGDRTVLASLTLHARSFAGPGSGVQGYSDTTPHVSPLR
ncbi:hypothetical protein LLE87_38775, partial [Paenibacillus polymyxa]|nr:hypothetical protein [Paenibacillus polymyxa]